MAQMSSRGTQLFCSLFIVVGLVVAGIGVGILVKSLRAEHWPVTDGIIQSAVMKSHSGNDGGSTYSAEVTYTYQVAGANYTGAKVAIGQMSASAGYAQGILNCYPVSKKVAVHYLPGDPAEAVLETGLHGGLWICLGVGTAFTLFGLLFLQISRAAVRAQIPGAAESSSVTVQPDGSVTMDKPPVLMGVIFLLAGIAIGLVPPESGKPFWMMYAAGSVFFCGGVMLLLYRLENKVYGKIASFVFLLPFLAIFHWIAFGAGERNGTISTPFSFIQGVSVRTPFAIFTILMDLAIVAGLTQGLFKRLAEEPGPRRNPRQPMMVAVAGLVLMLAIMVFFLGAS